MSATELVDSGRAAIDSGDWASARSLFTAALEQEETAEALYGLARVVERDGDFGRAIALYEKAFAAFRARGQTRLPALIAARELSFLYAAVHGNAAASAGWLQRARRLAAASGDCVERGWVELAEALTADDVDAEEAHARAALDIARRLDDPDLEFCALGYEGHCLIQRGRVVDGMRRVDESAAAATGGEVRDYLAVGEIYCKMLLCCEQALDVRRAQQWMAVAESFGKVSNAVWVSAICRMHYGAILAAAGRWAEADRELCTSLERYGASYPALRSGAVVRLADLRLRQGRFEDAARLLAELPPDGDTVRPLAGLHLARGEVEQAAALLRRFLGPARDGVLLAPALALLVEVELELGRVDAARQAVARLRSVASDSESPHLRAVAEYAGGRVCAASAEPAALGHFEAALAGFEAAGLPLEAARARLAIARLLVASDPGVAAVEARAALTDFDVLAAGRDADAAASVLRALGRRDRPAPRGEGPLTRREAEVLGLVAEGLSNAAIARRLFISRRTVEHHVSNILAKLGLASRAEALAFALRGRPTSEQLAQPGDGRREPTG